MTCAIAHRGPDDDQQWTDPERGIALGFRRLAILDLTSEGAQPMKSRDGRYVMVYNGEIYNFAEIRERLLARGHTFRGHSDTEVMLGSISEWGFDATLRELRGMFAIALWDRQTNTLRLARDRFGEKPLYYGRMGGVLLFGSELKALRAHPAWSATIDRQALMLYLRFGCVPAPFSIYTEVRKVEPATVVTITQDGRETTERYWQLEEAIADGLKSPLQGSEREILDEVEQLLRATIRDQMVADVPLGAFLSGGVDSSAVVALMQAQSAKPVRTFTIGFNESAYDEAVHAKAVARHLGTDHTELYVTAEDTRAVIPRLAGMYDEPFADSSQIPTFLVSQLARRQVTVALSGDGGDELFAGYNRYVMGSRMWPQLSRVPLSIRRGAARAIRTVGPEAWGRILGSVDGVLPRRFRVAQAGDRAHKLAGVMGARSEDEFYVSMASHWQVPGEVVIGEREAASDLARLMRSSTASTFVERMMYADARMYLSDDIMAKVDRASMAVSLETRAPFLDHRFVELVWRVPLSMKLRDGVGKWALRQILYRHVPQALIERPKMGFGVPIDSWLRGPLRQWAGDLLDEQLLRRQGFFNPAPIAQKWREHLAGSRNWQNQLWDVLMFQQWIAEEPGTRIAPPVAGARASA